MTVKNLAKHTTVALKAAIADEPVPSAVFLPPAQRGGRQVVYSFGTALPNVKQNMIRIENEADPIGLLIAIATGQPIATHTIDAEGNLKTRYETLPLSSPVRAQVIKHLADKILPRLSVKHTKVDEKTGDTSEWEAMVGGAADR